MDAEARKTIVVDFLKLAAGNARRAAERVLKPDGVHHNVFFPRGWEPLLAAMEEAAKRAPDTRIDVKHVRCDGESGRRALARGASGGRARQEVGVRYSASSLPA